VRGAADLLAVAVAKHQQEFDARRCRPHLARTASDLLYQKRARRCPARFRRPDSWEPDAHFTDAYQKVRNLLLSDDSKPIMPARDPRRQRPLPHGATSAKSRRPISTPRAHPQKSPNALSHGFLDESSSVSIIQRSLRFASLMRRNCAPER